MPTLWWHNQEPIHQVYRSSKEKDKEEIISRRLIPFHMKKKPPVACTLITRSWETLFFKIFSFYRFFGRRSPCRWDDMNRAHLYFIQPIQWAYLRHQHSSCIIINNHNHSSLSLLVNWLLKSDFWLIELTLWFGCRPWCSAGRIGSLRRSTGCPSVEYESGHFPALQVLFRPANRCFEIEISVSNHWKFASKSGIIVWKLLKWIKYR